MSPSVALWSLVGVNVRPASAPPGIVADERRQCVLPVARPARLKIFVCLLQLAISANLVDNWNGKGVAICESLFERCPGLCRQPSPSTILRWLLAEAAPHKNGDGKYSVEDREDGATGNAERSGETQPACNGSSTWPGGSCDGPLWLTSRRCPIKATATAAV